MALEKTWRWFGSGDPVSINDLRQMGVEGVVTALHHIPNGEVWPLEEILSVKRAIEAAGLRWSVVESLPVPEGIKSRSGDWRQLTENYRRSLRNLGRCGIDTVCYNFMPVLDWVRTDLHYRLPGGGEVMHFHFALFVAFDAFILKRPGAEGEYPAAVVEEARHIAARMPEEEAEALAHNLIVRTQAFIDGAVDPAATDYKGAFLDCIARYRGIDAGALRQHLGDFLRAVVPVAEESGVYLAIHPDDPPFPVLGLPRIVSTAEDLAWICDQYHSPHNGITFCTGSLSARLDNRVEEMARSLAPRIRFAHLRNTRLEPGGSFYESGHLEGRVDMYAVVKTLLEEQRRRREEGRADVRLPFRPDHGIRMLSDFAMEHHPGYPLAGRLKGLAELDGLQQAIGRELEAR